MINMIDTLLFVIPRQTSVLYEDYCRCVPKQTPQNQMGSMNPDTCADESPDDEIGQI